MKVEQDGELWVVLADSGHPVCSFKTNAEAWRWLEKHEMDPLWVKSKRTNRKAIEPHRTQKW